MIHSSWETGISPKSSPHTGVEYYYSYRNKKKKGEKGRRKRVQKVPSHRWAISQSFSLPPVFARSSDTEVNNMGGTRTTRSAAKRASEGGEEKKPQRPRLTLAVPAVEKQSADQEPMCVKSYSIT